MSDVTGLTTNQELFCVEYAATKDSVGAYKKAFSVTNIPDDKAKQYSDELLADPTIRQRIIRLEDTLAPRDIMTKTRVLEELSQIVRTALFPADRLRALDLLGKYYKLFSEKDNPQKVYVGENKIQIIYMSPDHKRITSISPLRKLLPATETDPEMDISVVPATTPSKSQVELQLEKDLDDICG
jgi:hypothetical protein